MSTLEELLDFIKVSGDDEQKWTTSDWSDRLSASVPDWKQVARGSENWEDLEAVRPTGGFYSALCRNLVDAAGLGLAKRWFHSEVSEQRQAAECWIDWNASQWSHFDEDMKRWLGENRVRTLLREITVDIWKDLDDEMKGRLLQELFDIHQGEPFDSMQECLWSIEHLSNWLLDSDFRQSQRDRLAKFPNSKDPNKSKDELARVMDLSSLSTVCVSRYVPSEKLQEVRSILQQSGDKHYLRIIDEFIRRCEDICGVISKTTQASEPRVPYRLNGDERELVARLLEWPLRNGYLPAALPAIYLSAETPPIFVSYPEMEECAEEDKKVTLNDWLDRFRDIKNRERRMPETVSIEELLGLYQPRDEHIIIYERGVSWFSREKGLSKDWLYAVVLIHELGHWIAHRLPKPGLPEWTTDLYVLGEREVHEGWAQLMTWWLAEDVKGEFIKTFETLNRGQARPYQVFKQFTKEPADEVMQSLERLRLLKWPARLDDWRIAIG